MSKKLKIVITGVNGLLGSYLYEKLRDDFQVIPLGRRPNKKISNLILCDITNDSDLTNIFSDLEFDIIIHCAAISGNSSRPFEEYDTINVVCLQKIIDLVKSKDVKRFIYLSSVSVYEGLFSTNYISESDSLIPISNYAKSKVKAENLLVRQRYFPFLILRLAPVYSNLKKKDFYRRIIKLRFGAFNFIIIPGSGRQLHSFCHISKLGSTISFFLKTNFGNGEVFNVSDIKPISTNQILEDFLRDKTFFFVLKLPAFVFRFFIFCIGLLLRKNKLFKSYYWKFCQNNLISAKKLEKFY